MLFPPKSLIGLLVLCAVSACGDQRVQVSPQPRKEVQLQTITHDNPLRATYARYNADLVQKQKDAELVLRTEAVVEAVRAQTPVSVLPHETPVQVPLVNPGRYDGPISVPFDVGRTMACIRAHESGNYTESSHPGSGSGAYQVIPSTWNVWSARAGYPGYRYAYEAPPSVQDAVVAYMLIHGGAGNWSVRYGPDPCTGH